MSEADVRAAFELQIDWSHRLRSPFTASLLGALAATIDRSTAVGRRVLDWPGEPVADALVLRLVGGLHALVRAGNLPGLATCYPPHPPCADLAGRVAVALADDRLLPWLDSAPQTNEVGRSAVLMAGLKTIAAAFPLPLRTVELGASGGLNLRLDAYAYDLGGARFGPAGAPLVLAPEWTGPPPPAADVRIIERVGVDRAPLDVARAGDRLLAYVWPDQPERVARLAAAIDAFIADPAPLVESDAADFVDAEVKLRTGVVTVVLHSIAFQYFPAAGQARIAAHLERVGQVATAEAPLAWLRYEFDHAGAPAASLRLRLWPGDDRLLARAHPHGARVEWLG